MGHRPESSYPEGGHMGHSSYGHRSLAPNPKSHCSESGKGGVQAELAIGKQAGNMCVLM